MRSATQMYRIAAVTPNLIQIEVIDTDAFKANPDTALSIGSYLRISDENGLSIIAVVQSYRIKDIASSEQQEAPKQPSFVLDAQPVGFLDGEGNFMRGGQQIAIPPTNVEIADSSVLESIYGAVSAQKAFSFGTLVLDGDIRVQVDGDRFFSKHIAVVGSTGSGKSCTVAKLLQEGVKPSDDQNKEGVLNNSHIVLFDLHGEYCTAFPKANCLDVRNMALPYWLMNSEELEDMFIETGDQNAHNQISQFKYAVIENKRQHNAELAKITYDTPVCFSIDEIHTYIYNQNYATKDAVTGIPAISDSKEGIEEKYRLFHPVKFQMKKTGVINSGPYAGEFDRFVSRLETKLNDDRLQFLLRPRKSDGSEYKTDDFEMLLKQFIGYNHDDKANLTIVDLSGIPFEVVSVVVSLITRLVFDFCFHFKRVREGTAEVPVLLVYEEAHNYVPNSESAKYRSVRKSIERVAKEGRKYGISLMIVSQRPSEIAETIFSQCNNFVAMRLTNPTDQNYIRRLLPDSVSAITDSLPALEKQEALVIGDSIAMPTILKVDDIEDRPDSADVHFHQEWQKDWYDVVFKTLLDSMQCRGE